MPRRSKKQPLEPSTQDRQELVTQLEPEVALINSETCAFRALQAVKAAERAADQAMDLSIRIGRATPEMLQAVFAAFEARRAAALAEKAAMDPRYRNSYETARSAYGQASQATHRAELALRRLLERVPNLVQEIASGVGKDTDKLIVELLGANPIANPTPTV